jgi:hypothetical protein
MTDAPVDQSNGKAARPPLILFVHIPKTAGTAVHNVLSLNQVGRPREVVRWNLFKGTGGVDRSLYDRVRGSEGPLVRRSLMVRGHVPLGLREYLRPFAGKGRAFQYLTFLRDPVDRMVSHFFAVVDEHGGVPDPNWGKGLGLSPLSDEPTLGDAIAGGYLHDNLQTRMLSGIPEPFGEVTEETLERAKENLRDPRLLLGLAERFDESLVLMKRRFGLRCILSFADDRVNSARPRGREVPVELVAAAAEANRYDVELYRYARQRFDAESELSEPDFQTELAVLGAARGTGPIHVDHPPPQGLDGTPDLWREHVAGLAYAQRLEWEVGELCLTVEAVRAKKEKLEQDLAEQSEAYERALTKTGELDDKLRDRTVAYDRALTKTRELDEKLTHRAEAYERALTKTGELDDKLRDLKSASARQIADLERQLGEVRAERRAKPGARAKPDRRRTKAKRSDPSGHGSTAPAKAKRRDDGG